MGFVPDRGQSIGISEIFWSFIWRFTLFTGFLTDRGCGCFYGTLPDGVFRTADLAGTRAVLVHFQCYIFVWNAACAVQRRLLKAAGFLYPLQLLALAVGMYFVVKTELAGYTVIPPLEEKSAQRSACRADLDVSDGAGCAFLHEKIRWLEAVGSFFAGAVSVPYVCVLPRCQ